MIIQASNKVARPIVQPPQHTYENFKTPTQQKIAREKNLANSGVKQTVQKSIDEVYKGFQKMVENTDYNVSYKLDETSGGQKFFITMKNTGNKVAEFPPPAAEAIAERSKSMTVGALYDLLV